MGNNIISSLGAGSGIDIKNLVEGLVAVERAGPEQRLDTKKEKLDAQISAYGTLSSSLDEFKKVLDPLSNPDLFNARSASFPSSNEFITANELKPDAQTGTFNIEAVQTAQSQSLASASVTDPASQLLNTGDGTQQLTIRFGAWSSYSALTGPAGFTVNPDEETLTLDITEGKSSLNDIAEAINDADRGLQASVIDDGSGQSKLLLTSPSGAQNSVEITASDPKLAMVEFKETGAASPMSQTQASRDAIVNVNGLQVTRASNTMDDVVKGFDFTLNKESAGEVVTFSIEQDSATAEQAIRDFVEAYNAFAETAKNLIGVTEDEESGEKVAGSLSTDGTAKQIVSAITGSRSKQVTGVAGDFSLLASAGIMTNRDGSLEIDEDDFKNALDNNYDDVMSLFARSSGADTSLISVDTLSYKAPASGSYEVAITQDPVKASTVTGVVNPADFPLNTGVGGTYGFKFSVHGMETELITLPDNQNYATPDDMAAALEAAINGDTNIAAKSELGVTVNYDSGTNQFTFESTKYGGISTSGSSKNYTVGFSMFSANLDAAIKVSTAVDSVGKDVAGTINGESAFGSGSLLLADSGTQAHGLSLTIAPGLQGSTSTVSFGNGFAGELISTINAFLGTDGTIDAREERITEDLEEIKEDRETLDTRMSKLEIRYYNQFLAMESIISSLNNTSNQLDSILQTLPFTADNN